MEKRRLLSIFGASLILIGTLALDHLYGAAAETGFGVEILSLGSDATVKQTRELFHLKSGTQDSFEIRLDSMVLRGLPETEFRMKKMEETGIFELSLVGGRIWFNSINSISRFKVDAGKFVFHLEPGVFDLNFDGNTATLSAVRHSAFAEFVGRRLVISEGKSLALDQSKVDRTQDQIVKLRYAKLVKEFPLYAVAPDEWIDQNSKFDEAWYQKNRDETIREIRDRGPRLGFDELSSSFKAERGLENLLTALTLDKKRKAERSADAAFAYFDAAVFAKIVGKDAIALKRGASFSRLQQSLPVDVRNRSAAPRAAALSFALPGDTLFEDRVAVRTILEDTPLKKIHAALLDVLDAQGNRGQLEAARVMDNLLIRFAELSETTADVFTDPTIAEDLFFEQLLLNDFLSTNDALLREEYLKTAWNIEQAYLKLLQDSEALRDEQQFFIREKIERMKKIEKLLKEDAMPFQEGRKALLALFAQVERLRPIVSDTAVLLHFDGQLDLLRPTVSFLKSSGADKVRSDYALHFDQYKKRVQQAYDVQALLQQSSGGSDISPFRREELAAEVRGVLEEIGLSEIKLVLPDDEDSALVSLESAVFEGKNLSASYNTDSQIFSTVVLDGAPLQGSVARDKLRVFLLVKLGTLKLPDGVSEDSLVVQPSDDEQLAQRTRAQIRDAFTQAGMTVEEKYIGLEDIENSIAHVRLALLGEGSATIVFSCDVDIRTNMISKLSVQTVSGAQKIDEAIPLIDLATRIQQVSERAIFELEQKQQVKEALR